MLNFLPALLILLAGSAPGTESPRALPSEGLVVQLREARLAPGTEPTLEEVVAWLSRALFTFPERPAPVEFETEPTLPLPTAAPVVAGDEPLQPNAPSRAGPR